MATQRLLKSQPGTLTGTILDTNGDPTAPAGTVTVAVASVSGATILAPGTATTAGTGTGPGVYQVAVTPAQTFQLDQWVATWTDSGNGSTQVTYHEVCGGFFFGLAEARASDPTLNDTSKYPDAVILQKRQSVEDEAEFICDVPFVPRYRRVLLDGTAEAEIYLPDSRIRVIRSVTITLTIGQTVTWTPTQIAELALDPDGQLQRTDGGIFDEGKLNVIVEYECGFDAPPSEVKEAGLLRLRYVLNRNRSGIPLKATSFVTEGGQTYKLDTPDAFATGIPDVDAAYNRYSTREFDDADPIPVSRQVNIDPSWFSVYHGGRR